MALPWIFVGGLVGAAAWAFSGDDDKRSSSSSDRDDREREARRKEREAKREQLNEEIKTFKVTEEKRIQQKYNAQIEFSGNSSLCVVKKDNNSGSKIDALKFEQDELKQFIAQLHKERVQI
ncbi:MAG: hypothetical protein KU28_03760 [Sulfurovum sp. PC08-66]|jgi:hypothetical protein|nr:MAG: hypothetical protein KU28_03760 [Sulfurovum sp. PC08-66]